MGKFVRRLSQRRHSLGAHPSPHRPPLRLFPHNLPLLLIPLLQLPLLPQILLLLILLKTNSSTKSLVFCLLVPRTPISAQGATLCPRKPAHDPFFKLDAAPAAVFFLSQIPPLGLKCFLFVGGLLLIHSTHGCYVMFSFDQLSCQEDFMQRFLETFYCVAIPTTLAGNLHEFRK